VEQKLRIHIVKPFFYYSPFSKLLAVALELNVEQSNSPERFVDSMTTSLQPKKDAETKTQQAAAVL
jgi:hypothetical protein